MANRKGKLFQHVKSYITDQDRQDTLLSPDERQLARGVRSTSITENLDVMVDSLIRESASFNEECARSTLQNALILTRE